jgi:hypothetical protein
MQLDSIYFSPMEWSGTMPMMNWASTGRQVRWIVRDPATGRENMDVDWRFRRGHPVKIRLVNQRRSFHAMQHPIHLHGQRFLVLAVNGVRNENLVWKDTVLLPAGAAVDIRDRSGGVRRLETGALFLFIGADANSQWLRGCVELDRNGFVLTGPALPAGTSENERWRAVGRNPFLLETSLPGVFAAGDVRSGSVKRCATAVGEGAMAVNFVHQHIGPAVVAA